MEIGDLVVRNPDHWNGGLDEIGVIVKVMEDDEEMVCVQWTERPYRRFYNIWDLELYHEGR